MGKTDGGRRPRGAGGAGGRGIRAHGRGGAAPGLRRARRRRRRWWAWAWRPESTAAYVCRWTTTALGGRAGCRWTSFTTVLGPVLADPRVRRTAHDAKALSLLLLGCGLELAGRWTATSSCSRTCSTPRAGSTRWRTWPASGCASSCRLPSTPRRHGGRGAAAAGPASGGGGRGLRRSARRRRGGSPRAVAEHRVGWADRAGPRAGAAAGAGAGPDGAPRRPAGPRRRSRELSRDVDGAVPSPWSRAAPARRARVQRQLQRPAGAGALHELKLPVLKSGKTGPSTDHEVLEKLASSTRCPGRSSSTGRSPS